MRSEHSLHFMLGLLFKTNIGFLQFGHLIFLPIKAVAMAIKPMAGKIPIIVKQSNIEKIQMLTANIKRKKWIF